MPSLLSLPDELLLEIIKYLDQDHSHADAHAKLQPPSLTPALPWWHRSVYYKHITSESTGRSSPRPLGLYSLLLTSRRLYKLVKPFVYRRVFVRGGDESPQKFYDTIVRNPRLLDRLNCVVVGCTGVDTFELSRKLFWARSLRKLSLVEVDWIDPRHKLNHDYSGDDDDDEYEDEDEDDDEDLIETSPLEHLELVRCSADGAALSKLLNWPYALKTLHYDVSHEAWARHYDSLEGANQFGPVKCLWQ